MLRQTDFSSQDVRFNMLLKTKNEKSKDYCKADLKQRVLFFITIFRLAIPAFFRFTDVLKTVFRTVFVDRLWQHNPCNSWWPGFYHYLRISWNPNHSPGIACSWKIGQHRFKKGKQTPTQKTSRYGLPRIPMSFPGKSKYVHQFMLLRFNLGGGNNSPSAFGARGVCCVYCLFHVRDHQIQAPVRRHDAAYETRHAPPRLVFFVLFSLYLTVNFGSCLMIASQEA